MVLIYHRLHPVELKIQRGAKASVFALSTVSDTEWMLDEYLLNESMNHEIINPHWCPPVPLAGILVSHVTLHLLNLN